MPSRIIDKSSFDSPFIANPSVKYFLEILGARDSDGRREGETRTSENLYGDNESQRGTNEGASEINRRRWERARLFWSKRHATWKNAGIVSWPRGSQQVSRRLIFVLMPYGHLASRYNRPTFPPLSSFFFYFSSDNRGERQDRPPFRLIAFLESRGKFNRDDAATKRNYRTEEITFFET